jgi:hypothetical protein
MLSCCWHANKYCFLKSLDVLCLSVFEIPITIGSVFIRKRYQNYRVKESHKTVVESSDIGLIQVVIRINE